MVLNTLKIWIVLNVPFVFCELLSHGHYVKNIEIVIQNNTKISQNCANDLQFLIHDDELSELGSKFYILLTPT